MAGITWLADVLRAAGLQVVEEGDWRSRGVTGSFEPIGVLWHHTGTPSSESDPAPSVQLVIEGRSDLEGPLCHALVDYNGVFHLISANRANHAGDARASGPIPDGDGNELLIGWEIDYAGDQDAGGPPDQVMTPAQYSASVAATAAVLNRLERDASYARGHRETSTTGKIDPSFVNLDQMRADVARALEGGTSGAAQLVIVGTDGVVYHQVRQPNWSWTGFRPLEGTNGPARAKQVSVSQLPDGSAQVAIIGTNDRLLHRVRRPDGSWTAFQTPPGAPASGKDVAVAGLPDGSAQLVMVGPNDVVYHAGRHANGDWTAFSALDGTSGPAFAKRVSIGATGDRTTHVAIIGTNDVLYHRARRPDGSWTPFAPPPGPPTEGRDVAVAGLRDNSAQVVMTGLDDVVYHRGRHANGQWTEFAQLDGSNGPAFAKRVSIGATPDRTTQVAIIGTNDVVYHRIRRPDGSWTGFQPVPGTPGSTTAPKGSDAGIG